MDLISVLAGYITYSLSSYKKKDLDKLNAEVSKAKGVYNLENILLNFDAKVHLANVLHDEQTINITDPNLSASSSNILRKKEYSRLFKVYGTIEQKFEKSDLMFVYAPLGYALIDFISTQHVDIKRSVFSGIGFALGFVLSREKYRAFPRSYTFSETVDIYSHTSDENEYIIRIKTPLNIYYELNAKTENGEISNVTAHKITRVKRNIFSKNTYSDEIIDFDKKLYLSLAPFIEKVNALDDKNKEVHSSYSLSRHLASINNFSDLM